MHRCAERSIGAVQAFSTCDEAHVLITQFVLSPAKRGCMGLAAQLKQSHFTFLSSYPPARAAMFHAYPPGAHGLRPGPCSRSLHLGARTTTGASKPMRQSCRRVSGPARALPA